MSVPRVRQELTFPRAQVLATTALPATIRSQAGPLAQRVLLAPTHQQDQAGVSTAKAVLIRLKALPLAFHAQQEPSRFPNPIRAPTAPQAATRHTNQDPTSVVPQAPSRRNDQLRAPHVLQEPTPQQSRVRVASAVKEDTRSPGLPNAPHAAEECIHMKERLVALTVLLERIWGKMILCMVASFAKVELTHHRNPNIVFSVPQARFHQIDHPRA